MDLTWMAWTWPTAAFFGFIVLALAGMSVRLFEPGEPGGEASGASAGMLGAQLETERHDPLTDLGLASKKLYDEFHPRA